MPGLGATGGSKWQLSVGWREAVAHKSYYRSDPNSSFNHLWQPEERQSIMDVSARYAFSRRFGVTATLPIVLNRFSMRFPPQGSLGKRIGWNANNIGDLTLYAQSWLLSPETHLFGNIATGVGLKVPTGNWDVRSSIPNLNGFGFSERAVYPPSLMPGDGGTALIFGINGYKNLRKPILLRGNTVFFNASYLLNPRNTNGTASIVQNLGVPLAPQFLGELTNSVTDSFIVQAGASIKLPRTWDKPKLKGLRFRTVASFEGIPSRDLLFRSDGYRQPGYILSVAPGFTYANGRYLLIADVPITFNAYIDPFATAIPGLPKQTAKGPQPAAFTGTRNMGLIAPVGINLRVVRTF